jgi:hypothetical protein
MYKQVETSEMIDDEMQVYKRDDVLSPVYNRQTRISRGVDDCTGSGIEVVDRRRGNT